MARTHRQEVSSRQGGAARWSGNVIQARDRAALGDGAHTTPLPADQQSHKGYSWLY